MYIPKCCIALVLMTLLSYSLWWYLRSETLTKLEMDQVSYTLGQLHYLSMDSRMARCWNSTIKKFLQLSCPHMIDNSANLEVEMTYLLTSCFCISIGMEKLKCRVPSPRDIETKYYFSLIECGMGKCFNNYDVDGFEINHSRIKDLCHYFMYEAQSNPDTIITFIEDTELERMRNIVSGKDLTEFDVRLELLQRITEDELRKRQSQLKTWLNTQFNEFWVRLDDLQFRFRVGKYWNVPFY